MNFFSIKLFLILFALICCCAFTVKTTKNKDLLYFEDFEWRKRGTSKNGLTQFWGCTRKTCYARAHSPFGTEELLIIRAHSHALQKTK